MPWPKDWNRSAVLFAIEEASHVGLDVNDPLPDTLIAQAQELGLTPTDLRLWIHDGPEHPWTTAHLAAWAQRMNLGDRIEPEGDSTDEIPRRDDGVQEARR